MRQTLPRPARIPAAGSIVLVYATGHMAGTASGDSGDGGEAAEVVEAARAARVASARADFIASLGRRTTELRTSLLAIEQEPTSARTRDVLRRRVHALTSGAKLLRFGAMATSLGDAESLLDEAAHVGVVRPDQIQAIAHIIDRLPSLAWGEPKSERLRSEPPALPTTPLGEAQPVAPVVLLVGPAGFAEALTEPADRREVPPIECERCDLDAALDKARSFSPDVIVLDADLRGASDLLRQLYADPLVEMPIIAVGSFSNPEQAANWLGAGAVRTVAKPVSPAALRMACRELAITPKPHSTYSPLGSVTVDELASRLADEVKRGLSEAVIPQAKANRIPLGHGAEVLAAVWAAVARVREIVTIKTEGDVRFSSGPEGALPLALWWNHEPAIGDRGVSGSRGEPETLLDSYSAIVADDDPAVAWFLASVLRAAGAKVLEAHDGDKALALCIGRVPDLVISDVLMPGLDGFALCRALKRDIALRDVPVILLSWKEDLLQRLRELGAAADGYLRKEASAAVILQRVTEVLRPRMRIEARLRGQGEVRGRLDGITPRLLLEMVAKLRPDARVCIHDASFLYEVEFRSGAPRNATRTTSEGVFQRGPEIFGAMLGARAGRFSVAAADGPVRGSLTGSLREQMAFPVARARAAARLLGGTRLLDVHRVLVDIEGVLPYLGATPESARSLVERLASGDSPRSMILGGEVAPAALEDVLSDLAAHGAVRGVHGASNLDLLEGAIRRELAMLDELEATARTPTNRGSSPGFRVGAAVGPSPFGASRAGSTPGQGTSAPWQVQSGGQVFAAAQGAAAGQLPVAEQLSAVGQPAAAAQTTADAQAFAVAQAASGGQAFAAAQAASGGQAQATVQVPAASAGAPVSAAAERAPLAGEEAFLADQPGLAIGRTERIALEPRFPEPDGAKRAEAGEQDFDLLADDVAAAAPPPSSRGAGGSATRAKLVSLDPSDPDEDEAAPSSLEAAVIRELSGPTPLPGPVGTKEAPAASSRDALQERSSSSRISVPSAPRASRAASLARPVLHISPSESAEPLVARATLRASDTASGSTRAEPSGQEPAELRRVDRSSPRPPDGDLSSLPPDAIVPGGESSEDKLAIAPPSFPRVSGLAADIAARTLEPGAVTPMVEPGTPLLGLVRTAEPVTVEPGAVVTADPGSVQSGDSGTPVFLLARTTEPPSIDPSAIATFEPGAVVPAEVVPGVQAGADRLPKKPMDEVAADEIGTPRMDPVVTAELGTPLLGTVESNLMRQTGVSPAARVSRESDLVSSETGTPFLGTQAIAVLEATNAPPRAMPAVDSDFESSADSETDDEEAFGAGPRFDAAEREGEQPAPADGELTAVADGDDDLDGPPPDEPLEPPPRNDDGPILTLRPDPPESGWFWGTAAILLGVGLLVFAVRFGLQRVGAGLHMPAPNGTTPALARSAGHPEGSVSSVPNMPVPAVSPGAEPSESAVTAASPSPGLAVSGVQPEPTAAIGSSASAPSAIGSHATGAASASPSIRPLPAATPGAAPSASGGSVPAAAVGAGTKAEGDLPGRAPTPAAAHVAETTKAAIAASAGITGTEDLPLPQGTVLNPEQGLLEVETVTKEAVFVDGVERGRGPAVRVVLSAGVHEVRLRYRDEDRVRFVLVRAGRRAHLSVKTPWSP